MEFEREHDSYCLATLTRCSVPEARVMFMDDSGHRKCQKCVVAIVGAPASDCTPQTAMTYANGAKGGGEVPAGVQRKARLSMAPNTAA